jgi:hypothetical protein
LSDNLAKATRCQSVRPQRSRRFAAKMLNRLAPRATAKRACSAGASPVVAYVASRVFGASQGREIALTMALSMWQQTGTAVMLVPWGPSTSGCRACLTMKVRPSVVIGLGS